MPFSDLETIGFRQSDSKVQFARLAQSQDESEYVFVGSNSNARTHVRIAKEDRLTRGVSVSRRLISATTLINYEGKVDTFRVNLTFEAPTAPATPATLPYEELAALLRTLVDIVAANPADTAPVIGQADFTRAQTRINELLLGLH